MEPQGSFEMAKGSMVFLVNLTKYSLIALFGLALITGTVLIFWSFTSEGSQIIGGYSIPGVLAFLGIAVSGAFGLAVLISIHDRILEATGHISRLADALDIIAGRSLTDEDGETDHGPEKA